MGAFILLITLQFSQGVSVASAEYSSQETCMKAGKEAVERMEGMFSKIRYSCSPK